MGLGAWLSLALRCWQGGCQLDASQAWIMRAQQVSKSFKTVVEALGHGTSVDIHAVVDEDPIVHAIHENAEVHD
jgi:hypothetical protein